jgi:CBS domain-containing protein
MKCKELMTPNPVFCHPMAPAANVARMMKEHHVGAVLVDSDPGEKKLLRIVTDRDLALRVTPRLSTPRTRWSVKS